MNIAGLSNSLLAFLRHWIGLDRAIVYTVLARFWSVLAGLVTLFLIARFLSPSEQGYYYTFYSMVALQIVFELGFSFVILQLAAHERALLTFLPNGCAAGDQVALSRLASVLKKAVFWYSGAGLVMALVLMPAGIFFFQSHQSSGVHVQWQSPWSLLVIAAMLAFQIDPVFSFLEGCGFVAQVANRRMVQALLGSFLAWAAILSHHGLYSPAMVILGQVAVGLGFLLFSRHRHLLKQLLFRPSDENHVGWRSEIWPFQWRIAVSWICGYFIYQIFSPILFAYQGPIAAGKMGMSLNISAAIAAVALAWMNTKASPFGAMIARGEYKQLDKLFFRTLWQSTLMLCLGNAFFILCLLFAERSFPRLADRMLSPGVFALLLLGSIINHITTSEALYLRAHKQEPFMMQAVVSAILIGTLTFFLGKHYGANAVVYGLFAQGILFGLPSGIYIFLSKRRAWHKARTQTALSQSA